jgi:isochorismate synthase
VSAHETPGRAPTTVRPRDTPSELLACAATPGGFVFTRDGDGLAGEGAARRITVTAGPAQVTRAAALAQQLSDVAGGSRDVVVVGALPFNGDVDAVLTLPARTLWSREGRITELRLESDTAVNGHTASASAAFASATHGATHGTTHGTTQAPPMPDATPAEYTAAVRETLRRIADGELRKAVIARSRLVEIPRDPGVLLRRLAARDPHCHVFAAPTPDGWIAGATPEVVVRRHGSIVSATPLAGSAARGTDPASDRAAAEALTASAKDLAEHRLVVEAVADALAPLCAELSVDPTPSLTGTATVWHLATNIRGVLRDRDLSALALAARLHPTPAVGGVPRDAALHAIAELESVPRRFYSGLVGWVDSAGDGEWALSLRCVEVNGHEARLFAGAGVIAGSDPDAELAETEMKFGALLEALSPS